ncbi:MAG: class I SAM-dependent methyltransferase [Candidatus Parcubacteria bacterium]|nr:class I SAM-dependent methyltransferase [Candidatus Parcubacteria bacterium]
MASEERFGYEWDKYDFMDPIYEEQFKNWTGKPAEFWRGKDILDAGCGMGRNSYWPLKYGARSVVAFDNDERSLASVKQTLSEFSHAKIERHDLSEIGWKNQFDIVMCIGVLHHVRRPELALKNMVQALRNGGELVIWVYSYEGNEWIVRFVNPIRKKITSRLPLPIVHFLSYLCSVPLWIFVKIFHGPTPYMKQLSSFTLQHVHCIVFDQLIPSVANYWKKGEVESLAKSAGLKNFSVKKPKNNMGWILTAKKNSG